MRSSTVSDNDQCKEDRPVLLHYQLHIDNC